MQTMADRDEILGRYKDSPTHVLRYIVENNHPSAIADEDDALRIEIAKEILKTRDDH